MAPNLVAKWAKLPTPLHLLLCHSETKWHIALADMRINSSTNCSTSGEKIVKIGSVVLELK